jgi:hypothetical protein
MSFKTRVVHLDAGALRCAARCVTGDLTKSALAGSARERKQDWQTDPHHSNAVWPGHRKR